MKRTVAGEQALFLETKNSLLVVAKKRLIFNDGSREDFLNFVKTLEPGHDTSIILNKRGAEEDLNALLERLPHGTKVRYLSLEGSVFHDKDLAQLSQNRRLVLTNRLHLGNCGFSDRGLAKFVQAPLLSGLKALHLNNRISSEPGRKNEIGDFAAHAIARSPTLETLEELDFWNTDLGDEGLRALIASPKLPRLSKICAWRTQVTRKFYDQIEELTQQREEQLGRPAYLRIETDYNLPSIDYFRGDYD